MNITGVCFVIFTAINGVVHLCVVEWVRKAVDSLVISVSSVEFSGVVIRAIKLTDSLAIGAESW